MAWTFTTLKSSIQDYLETTESTFVSELPNIITRAEERILKSVQLPNFRKNVTGACVSGNPYLQTPSDFLALYSIALDNSGYEFLLNKDVNFIREAYPENALLYGCLVEGYTFLKGDADLMSQYQAKYQESLDKLETLGEGYDTTDSYRSGAVRKARS